MKIKFPTYLDLYSYIFLLVVLSNKDTIDFVMGHAWYLAFVILLSILWIAGTIISKMEKHFLIDTIKCCTIEICRLKAREKARNEEDNNKDLELLNEALERGNKINLYWR